MKTKQELEKAIKDTIIKYKEIIFGVDSPISIKCLDELRKQQVINEYSKEAGLGWTPEKYSNRWWYDD